MRMTKGRTILIQKDEEKGAACMDGYVWISGWKCMDFWIKFVITSRTKRMQEKIKTNNLLFSNQMIMRE